MQARDLSSAASSRLEGMFSKLYSSVLVVSFIEVIANAIAQSVYLNGWSWFLLVMTFVPIGAMVFWAWRFDYLWIWPRIHGIVALFALMMWPWIVADAGALPAEFQPWVWWVMGMAAISFGSHTPPALGFGYLVAASVAWYFVDTSYFAGYSDPWVSLQDSVYLFLVGGTISGLLIMVRQAARRTDEANSAFIASAIEQAQTDAVERERQRIDALVHDHVLNTLVLASKAESKSEQDLVVDLAKDSVLILEQAAKEPESSGEVTLLGLYRALRKAALRLSDTIQVETHVDGHKTLPSSVAQAVTEATLQALDNAIRHSRAKNIRLNLGVSDADDLLIRVSDDGVGFRMDRIARDRIGIKTSILARLRTAGANAEILSEPSAGTTVIIRWSA